MSNQKVTIGKKEFKVISLLGSGTFGSVYEVDENGKRYALKVIDNKFKEGIKSLREIDIMGRFRHPNLTFAQEFFTEIANLKDKEYSSVGILMEKADTDLFAAMMDPNFSYTSRIKCLYDITKGLSFMHSQNYLHLDIKPLNVLIFNDLSKLTDYGLALLEIEKDGKKYGTYPLELVTIDHRSPYIINGGRDYTDKDDIWSLGLVFLEVLSGGSSIFKNFKMEDFTDRKVLDKYNEKFSSGMINSTLEAMISKTLDPSLRRSAIELIRQMLNFNSLLRPSTTQILSSPLFSKFGPYRETGLVLTPAIPPYECNIYFYEGIDTLIRVSTNLPISLETFFLSVDLFVRFFSFFPIPSKDRYKHVLYLTCLSSYMAMKMIESYFPDPERLSTLTGGVVTARQIIEGENKVVPLLGGMIYVKNLFNVSTTKRRIEEAFKICNNCFLYPMIDLDEWYKLSLEEEKTEGKFDKYISFNSFIISNQYYKTMMDDPVQRDYISEKYTKDKEKM